MSAILLTILKILLIVIASLAGLVIAIALIILFVPVRYRIKADKATVDDELFAKAYVSFLLHIFSAFISYDEDLSYGIKIFGHKLGNKEKGNKPEKEENHKTEDDITTDSITGSVPDESSYEIDWNDEVAEDDKDDFGDIETYTEGDDLDKKINDIIEKLTGKYEKAKDKYDSIRKEIRFWKKMADDKRNKDAVALIKKEILRLLGKIAPKKIKGFVHFGFDDPSTTGSILMYLSMIYPVLPRKFKIDPSFEDTQIFGSIDIKGHLCFIVPAISFLKIFFNKDCKRMYRLYKRHSSNKI